MITSLQCAVSGWKTPAINIFCSSCFLLACPNATPPFCSAAAPWSPFFQPSHAVTVCLSPCPTGGKLTLGNLLNCVKALAKGGSCLLLNTQAGFYRDVFALPLGWLQKNMTRSSSWMRDVRATRGSSEGLPQLGSYLATLRGGKNIISHFWFISSQGKTEERMQVHRLPWLSSRTHLCVFTK